MTQKTSTFPPSLSVPSGFDGADLVSADPAPNGAAFVVAFGLDRVADHDEAAPLGDGGLHVVQPENCSRRPATIAVSRPSSAMPAKRRHPLESRPVAAS